MSYTVTIILLFFSNVKKTFCFCERKIVLYSIYI